MPHAPVEEVAEARVNPREDVRLEGDEPTVVADLGVFLLPLGPRLPVAGDVGPRETLEGVQQPSVLVGKDAQHRDERRDHVLLVAFDQVTERSGPLRAVPREERGSHQRGDVGVRSREAATERVFPEGIAGVGRRLGGERRGEGDEEQRAEEGRELPRGETPIHVSSCALRRA